MMIDHKIPFNRSLLWILVSTLLISGSAFTGWLYFLHIRERRLHDEQYRLAAIIQSTPQSEALKTVYLAELLDLSLDRPVNLYQFNVKEASETLLKHPLIKNTTIKKILPGTLFIHYQMRTPIAYIGDFTNTAIDAEGYLFPFRPFFTPKRLPIFYLGLKKEECKWGSCLSELSSLKLALLVLNEFEQIHPDDLRLKQLDVSQAEADSYGQRQIVLIIEKDRKKEKIASDPFIYLRLSSDHYVQDLTHFRTLHSFLFENQKNISTKIAEEPFHGMVIDLRISHLAFIKANHFFK